MDRNPGTTEEAERSLVLSVASGDEAAAARLFHVYGDSVLRFVYRRAGEQMEDAEEITLDTFGSAVKLAGSYRDSRSSILTWLCGIAKLRIIDFYRKAGRDKRAPAHMQTSLSVMAEIGTQPLDQVIDQIEAERIVDSLLAGLNPDEREVLLLRYVEQFSVREIATHMNRSEKGVEALLTRAKNKPRAEIEHWREGVVQ